VRRRPVVYHIPVCPFCQRLEILLNLKNQRHQVDFEVVDITKARDPELLKKMRGTTALPVLETADGKIIKESLVILEYLDTLIGTRRIAKQDPYRHAVEQMLIAKEGDFLMSGYLFVMNQNENQRQRFIDELLQHYRGINDFLMEHSPESIFLFDDFGLAEAVFTPIFMRFWFLTYYEGFDLPDESDFRRVRNWRSACITHSAAQQVDEEEIIKLYYDYAKGAGNGALLPGRSFSSFVFEPHWRDRPWPPKNKYLQSASDHDLGLI
jgi:glutathione S-transferase